MPEQCSTSLAQKEKRPLRGVEEISILEANLTALISMVLFLNPFLPCFKIFFSFLAMEEKGTIV